MKNIFCYIPVNLARINRLNFLFNYLRILLITFILTIFVQLLVFIHSLLNEIIYVKNSSIINLLVNIVVFIGIGMSVIIFLWYHILVMYYQVVARLHDLNMSAWWLLFGGAIMCISLVLSSIFMSESTYKMFIKSTNFVFIKKEKLAIIQATLDVLKAIFFIGLFLFPGTKGPNKYGDDPIKN